MHSEIHYPALARDSYVPYFYQSGRFLSYGHPSGRAPARPSSAPYSRYEFSSDRPLWQHPQTVEQVIAQGYLAVPRAEPEVAILSDKHHASWLGLDDTVAQIRRRYELYQQNVYELHQAVCEANNAVHRQVADQGAPANERQRYSANKMIQALYEQERSERINLWRDVSRLRVGLPEGIQQYLAAYRKLSILEDRGGGAP